MLLLSQIQECSFLDLPLLPLAIKDTRPPKYTVPYYDTDPFMHSASTLTQNVLAGAISLPCLTRRSALKMTLLKLKCILWPDWSLPIKQKNKNLRCGNRKGLLSRNDQTHHRMGPKTMESIPPSKRNTQADIQLRTRQIVAPANKSPAGD